MYAMRYRDRPFVNRALLHIVKYNRRIFLASRAEVNERHRFDQGNRI